MTYTLRLLHKITSITLALVLILMPLSSLAVAQESTETQQTETTQTTQESNSLQSVPPLQQVEQPKAPSEPNPNAVSQPTPPQQPEGATQTPTVSPTPTGSPLKKITEDEYFGKVPSPTSSTSDVQNAANPQGSKANGNVGDTSLQTGDATSNTGISNTGNTNTAGVSGCCTQGATAKNTGNGAHSTNNTSSASTNTTDTNQNNSAVIDNDLSSATVTGKNSTSFNVGDSSVSTGNANTTGTIYNNVNSNLAGVSVSEFNIADDHNGDYVLDFAANCILGCDGAGLASTSNTGNGAGSTNTANSNTTNNSSTTQNNDGYLVNNLNLLANSGDNYASFNTGGDSNITTGDANVSANVLNFMNTNAAGNVILGVVNIFGDLVGDILLPEGFGSGCTNCGAGGTTVANSDNGSHSTNTANSNTSNNSDTFQNNDATIENNLILSANSGDNKASFNTNGNSSVTTGKTDVNAQLLNIANMNISGGDWFLVIVNEGGKWIGKILGAPDGANFSGTSGTEFAVDENGQITASNAGNGAHSNNTSNTTTENNTTVDQNNNGHIVNNITLDANTGGNTSSYNTGGSSDIVTGDATVIANLVNFVNSNISGGRLVVTVVNVFGSWMGDFVSPGQTQREKTSHNQQTVALSHNTDNHGRGGAQSQDSSSDSGSDENELNEAEKGENLPANSSSSNPSQSGQSSRQSGYTEALVRVETEGNGSVAVLGESTSVEEIAGQAIRVNLAWIVVLVPALIVLTGSGIVIRKKLLSHRS